MKSPKAPKEDPAAKAARERERRLSEIDQMATTQDQAADLTADLRDVYGLRKLRQPGRSTAAPAAIAPKPPALTAYGTQAIVGNPNSFQNQALARRTLPSYLRPLGAQNGQSR